MEMGGTDAPLLLDPIPGLLGPSAGVVGDRCIPEIVQDLTSTYLAEHGLDDPRWINSGHCVEFAEELEHRLKQVGVKAGAGHRDWLEPRLRGIALVCTKMNEIAGSVSLPLSYAGIGSRETPPDVLASMRQIAGTLEAKGWLLHSGAAPGADSAFESGTSKREVFLPWKGFEGRSGAGYTVPSGQTKAKAEEIAAAHHPRWQYLTRGAKALHTRNVLQIHGKDLESPVSAVICWTKGGRGEGGTGQAIRIAKGMGIPVLDLGGTEFVVDGEALQVEDDFVLPHHAWVEVGGRLYDAETPNGVPAWMDLPCYQRFLEEHPEARSLLGLPG